MSRLAAVLLVTAALALAAVGGAGSMAPAAQATHEGEYRCPEDFLDAQGEANHFIDTFDLATITAHFGEGVEQGSTFDIAPDIPNGWVDTGDLVLVTGIFGRECYGIAGALETQEQAITTGEGMAAVTTVYHTTCDRHGSYSIGAKNGTHAWVHERTRVWCWSDLPSPYYNYRMNCFTQTYWLHNGAWGIYASGQGSATNENVCTASASSVVPLLHSLKVVACYQVWNVLVPGLLQDACLPASSVFFLFPTYPS